MNNFYEIRPTENHDAFVCAFFVSNIRVSAKKLIKANAHYMLSLLVDNEEAFPNYSLNYGLSITFKNILKVSGSTRFFAMWNPIHDLAQDRSSLVDIAFNDSKYKPVLCLKLQDSLLNVELFGNNDDNKFLRSFLKKAICTKKKYLTIVGAVGWGLEDRMDLPDVDINSLPKSYLFWDRGATGINVANKEGR